MLQNLDYSRLQIEPLLSNHLPRFASFTCGDADLDSFLKDDSLRLHEAHLSFTYVAIYRISEDHSETVGYISLSTDALTLDGDQGEKDGLPEIGFRVVPALKIGRLAVSESARGRIRGLGMALMGAAWIRGVDLASSIALRFLTVDAYPTAVGFYQKLGFTPNLSSIYKGKGRRTLSMRLDLFAPEEPSWLLGGAPSQVPPEDPPNPSPTEGGGSLDSFFQEHMGGAES